MCVIHSKYDFKENSFTICVYVWKNVYLSNAVITIFLRNLSDLRMTVICYKPFAIYLGGTFFELEMFFRPC